MVSTNQDGYQTVKDAEVAAKYPKAYKDLKEFGVITSSKTIPFGRLVYALWHRRYIGPRQYQGRTVAYQVHHQDGDRANNQIDNLVLLPANYHQQLHTNQDNGVPIDTKTTSAILGQMLQVARIKMSRWFSRPRRQRSKSTQRGQSLEAADRPYKPFKNSPSPDDRATGDRGPPRPTRAAQMNLLI